MRHCEFTLPQEVLVNALKQLSVVNRSSKRKETVLEVTVVKNYIQLVIPGAQLQLNAITTGSVKFVMSFKYFRDIAQSARLGELLHFIVTKYEVSLGLLSVPAKIIFPKRNNNLKSIDLPVNYSIKDILKLVITENFTDDEISFNNLDKDVLDAIKSLSNDIHSATAVLQKYGIKKIDIEDLIKSKLSE